MRCIMILKKILRTLTSILWNLKCIHKLPRPFLEMSSCWHLLPLHSWCFASAQYSLNINAQRRWTGLPLAGRWLYRCSLGGPDHGARFCISTNHYHDSVSADRTQVIHIASCLGKDEGIVLDECKYQEAKWIAWVPCPLVEKWLWKDKQKFASLAMLHAAVDDMNECQDLFLSFPLVTTVEFRLTLLLGPILLLVWPSIHHTIPGSTIYNGELTGGAFHIDPSMGRNVPVDCHYLASP